MKLLKKTKRKKLDAKRTGLLQREPAWFLFYQDPKKNRTKIGHWSHGDYAIFQAQISMIKSWHVHVKIINSVLTAAKTNWKSNFESTNLASNGLTAYHIHGDTRGPVKQLVVEALTWIAYSHAKRWAWIINWGIVKALICISYLFLSLWTRLSTLLVRVEIKLLCK